MNAMVKCSKCAGEGIIYIEFPVVDWMNGGFLDERQETCNVCCGDGVVEFEEEEDDYEV